MMSDKSFLQWPFFEDEHRELTVRLDDWASRHLPRLTADEHHDLDGTCKAIVRALGDAGFTTYAVPASAGGHHERLDVRSLCLIRETLARHNALADFAFAMQGLGSGPISLFGSAAQQAAYLVPWRQATKLLRSLSPSPKPGQMWPRCRVARDARAMSGS